MSISWASESIRNTVSKRAYPLYMQISKDCCIIHLSEHHGDGSPGAAMRIDTNDLGAFQEQLLAKDYKYARPGIEETPWGSRDMSVHDPFGNRLTCTSAISTSQGKCTRPPKSCSSALGDVRLSPLRAERLFMRDSMNVKASPHRPARIIVLGAERSGTSVVTEMIHRWGAYAGEPEQLTAANEHNPQGQWEYKPLWDFLAEVGGFAQGVTWWDATFEAHLTAKLRLPTLRGKALALMAEMECAGRSWVWKDPALCHFLPFWKPIWGDVAYVITVRHPYDVARSWQRYTVPARLPASVNLVACNLLRWQHMLLMVLRATEDAASTIFIEYEALVREPVAQARRLAAFLDVHCGSAPSAAPSLRAMAARVNPAWWRHHSDRALSEIAEATPAQCRLYEFVRSKVREPGKAFVDEYPMPPGWWEFVHNAEAVIRAHSP
jgi:hypothetical protein